MGEAAKSQSRGGIVYQGAADNVHMRAAAQAAWDVFSEERRRTLLVYTNARGQRMRLMSVETHWAYDKAQRCMVRVPGRPGGMCVIPY